MMPRKLFFKIFFGFWLITIVIATSIVILPSLVLSPGKIAQIKLSHHLKLVQRLKDADNLKLAINEIQHRMKRQGLRGHRRQHDTLFVINENHTRFNGHRLPKDIYLAMINNDENPDLRSFQFDRWLIYGPYDFRHQQKNYQLYIRDLNKHRLGNILSFLRHNRWATLSLVMFVSALCCGLLAWHIVRPINSLEKSARKLAQGDLNVRSDKRNLKYRDEIGQLAHSFDQMAQAVQTIVSGQQRLLGDISHEIRTPLTRLKLACAIHRRQFGDNDELSRIEQETQVIDKMLKQLLILSHLKLANDHDFESHDFNFFIEDIIDNALFEAHEANITLQYDIEADVELFMQWEPLSSAIENIIRNALRYATTKVHFVVKRIENKLILTIKDDGPGVDSQHLTEIFKPFYRVSESRERHSGGTGLGLAIAYEAILRHKGSISATNNEWQGLTISITLPLTQQ